MMASVGVFFVAPVALLKLIFQMCDTNFLFITMTHKTSGLVSLIKTFHSFSSPMVLLPVVILFSSTSVCKRDIPGEFGSIVLENAKLLAVYSCPA